MRSLLIAALVVSGPLRAGTSVSQKVGSYQDNTGAGKSRIDLGLAASISGRGPLDATDINLSLGYDERLEASDGAERLKTATQEIQLAVSQTWTKLTTTRFSLGQNQIQGKPAETYGVGASRWFFNEQVQVSADLFKNNAMRDVVEVLDQDSEVISPPRYYHSDGAVLSMRHLVNPKTVLNYAYSHISSNDRPDLWSASVGVKRFVENPWSRKYHAAVHVDAVRMDNTGRLSNASSVGELRGMIYQLAWLQNLGKATRLRLAYRQYRENEVTRVNKDEYFRGTDLLTAQFVRDFEAKASVPTALELSYHRYLTNAIDDQGTKIAANIYEFGLSAKL